MHCTDCGCPLVSDGAGQLRCPQHGFVVARIEDNALWDGEVVDVVGPTLAANGRYVVQFRSGKRRTVRASQLHPLEMKQPA